MNLQEILEILLGEFHDKLDFVKPLLVPRDAHFANAPNKIKVAMGMRRAGKTYFMFQQILTLLKQDVPLPQILYINFEDDRLLPLTREKLAGLIDAFYALYPENHDQKCYFFLDEIQDIPDWPIVIRRFHDSKNVEIFLTGSSAKLLSKEIATNLRGRSLATEIWPYSFSEFLRAKNITLDHNLHDQKTKDKLTQFFTQYLTEGGFPETIDYDLNTKQSTLQEYVDLVIYKDIVERYKISNTALIKYMIIFMLHNSANAFSINKFYNDIKSQGYKISKDLLYDFAKYIEDSYLVFPLEIYDQSIRKVQSNPKKIYAIDPGLIRATTLEAGSDLGRLFENVIYLDLRRKNYKINYYLTSERYEIDFLVQDNQGKKKLLQIVWDISDKETQAREERALKTAEKELSIKGEIITLDSYLRTATI